ncbi:MAG: 30S ribosomal protein S2 [Candidatus Moranbacteria bacterium CG_4_9_14_3_um_filter_42_9]|nr:MAG: 30S ribosomal protein S2 [Candidatus Moranbacteria bacterium CG_4_9_14_3_um_filter_42_9]
MIAEKKAVIQPDAVEAAAAKASSGEDYFANFDFGGLEVDMKSMLKAGVHFGHQKARRSPKMNEYIFGTKNGINIIDLEKTVAKLEEATQFVKKIVAEGQQILFVGTKKQAKRLVESAAKRCGMPFVVERWLGGTFTNFRIISERARYLRDGQEKMKKGEYGKYTKFEQMKIGEELDKLENKMGGIKQMTKFPGAIFVTGILEDNLAIQEARIKKIPIIALADTNVDPSQIDYPIPANEDAVSSLRLMIAYITKAVIDAKSSAAIPKENVAAEAKKTQG